MSDVSLIPGVQSATRQSWREDNPRPLLRRVMERADDPHNREAVREEFYKRTPFKPENEALWHVMREYWFDLNFTRLEEAFETPEQKQLQAQRRAEAKTKAEAEAKKIGAAVEAKAKRLLLETLMPNGKLLKDCTCAECKKMGGWLAKLAAKGQPRERIGDLLSEGQVRAAAPRDWE